tara:strand:- start:269 stop:988 length:720 start_codon:yes stop_codon:yes gene_type:complete
MGCSSHYLKPQININPTSTFFLGEDQSQIIPNIKQSKPLRDLRLVIHGSAGGEVHPFFKYLVRQVQHLRGTNVDLEVLTQENTNDSSSSSILLIPLFLLPGKHVLNDIPKIFKRLSNQGIDTQLVPFLGSWPYWISILKYFVDIQLHKEKSILLHHPINSGDYGNSYLKNLNRILKIPIISWTQWSEFSNNSDITYTPIPFALAPNKNTEGLRQTDSISSLLEVDLFLFNLIKILSFIS